MNKNLEKLRQTIINSKGREGELWFNNLPIILQKLEKHWSLKNIEPVSNMSWHYVAFAKQNGQPVVLKFGVDEKTIHDEYQALKHFNSYGMIQVLDYYQPLNALLLARAIPGRILKEESNHVIDIYADVVQKLSAHHPTKYPFLHVSEWCQVIDEMNDSRIPAEYILQAKVVRQWLLASMHQGYPCHGDLHLENIIQDKDTWLAIDPKGIIGEMAFEAAAFDLIQDNENIRENLTPLIEQRIYQLAQALNLDKRRLVAWIFLRMMLSIQWFIEDQGNPARMLNMTHHVYPILMKYAYE
jgi:streptomycin 6-kinase